ncbi:MAG: DUF885 domain-containing protein [Candidatus Latescibacterota bacterium]|nr:MAG: DUF885 domain-containing protein [Candidatus Latescibacterota bacterium]
MRALLVSFLVFWITAIVGEVAAQSPSQELARLAEEYWQENLRAHPVEATALGDRRYDDRLPDNSQAGRAREMQRLERIRGEVEALSATSLAEEERVTRSMLLEVIDADLAVLECGFADWVVDPLGGPQIRFLNIPSMQNVTTPEQARAMVKRWRAMGPYLDTHIANLGSGLARGRVATRDQTERVLEQLQETLAQDVGEWSLLAPLAQERSDWSASEREAFARDLRAAVVEVVKPAYERYHLFLRDEVMPRARSQEQVGVGSIPEGEACYAAMIRRHTSLELSPQEIHDIGQRETRRIMEEMRELGTVVLGTHDLKEILSRLRSDAKLYFGTRDEVEAKAREALGRAREAMPAFFGILPQAACVVVRMEPHEEKHSTIAYYRQPALDGSRPGRYYINTYAPETRPRYEAEALAFHEAIPGHHLQIAIAQELRHVPEFRKHTGTTAFVEGWALYTEQLSDEMGLYSADLDRIGKLSYEAWRACRLVVDTGMHALGWSRQQAVDFMLTNSALAENNIVNEVDRYITWPGQALAYKLGQLEILALRDEAREKAGARFDIREFHDVVLRNGAVSLATLREIVTAHYERAAASR